jgi:alpha-beta hydrolase superfamily lysophospholipase
MDHKITAWKSAEQLNIHAQLWDVDKPEFVIGLIHGFGEHIGRYQHFAEFYNKERGVVVGYDQIGHGKSGGKRGHFKTYEHLLDDVSRLLVWIETHYPDIPVFLYGHSMGGAVVMNYCLARNPNIQGLIATGPWIKLGFEPSPAKLLLAKTAKAVFPALVQPSGLDTSLLSKDTAVVDAYNKDPLVHGKISAGAAMAFMRAGEQLDAFSGDFPIPFLLMHGEEDLVTSFPASKAFAERVGGKLSFKPWPDMRHEIHNEPEQQEVFAYTMAWIKQHLPKSA